MCVDDSGRQQELAKPPGGPKLRDSCLGMQREAASILRQKELQGQLWLIALLADCSTHVAWAEQTADVPCMVWLLRFPQFFRMLIPGPSEHTFLFGKSGVAVVALFFPCGAV